MRPPGPPRPLPSRPRRCCPAASGSAPWTVGDPRRRGTRPPPGGPGGLAAQSVALKKEERVARIRTWNQGGIRAPHKPLLLLYALGRLQQQGTSTPVAFTEAGEPLDRLLTDFGPPHKTSPAYPFRRLANDDGLWVITTAAGHGSPDDTKASLCASDAKGELAPEFAAAVLADPALLVAIARDLLEANFPETYHADIAGQVGLDLMPEVPGGATPTAPKRRRSPEFRDQVLMAYELRCAMCGFDGRLGSESVGLEAAHVRWFNIGGPDTVANGLCLCALHYKLLDEGALGITPEHTLAVSARFVGVGQFAEELVQSLAGRELAEPQGGMPTVADAHISWYTTQVFRDPARAA